MDEKTTNITQDWDLLKNLSLDDAISKVANSIVDFTFRLLLAIAIFYIGRWLIRKIIGFIHNILESRKVDLSLATFVRSFVQILLYFILIVTIVGILGIETSSFLALFASAGVAIGMALSGTLQNFAGGVLILLLKPYKVGEYIETQGYAGTVNEIQMFHTIITTPDNKTIIIPNGPLSNGSVNNYSRQPMRRVDWTIAVAYGTDFAHAKAVIQQILDSRPEIIRGKEGCETNIFIGELADSSVNITVRAWVSSADYWPVFFAVNEQVYKTLPEQGVSFPFPQLDVHIQPQV